MLDPQTGALLAEEYVTLADNWLELPAGTRVGWSTYLRAEVVDHIKEPPAR